MMPNLLRRSLVNWPQKLGALVLATLVWTFVINNDESTTQRSLLVPITVQGVATNEVVVGLADVVEVTVSGPSTRVERLDAGEIDAILDLSGVSGDFTERIQVEPPRGIALRRVEPTSLQGLVTSVTTRTVPLVAVPAGPVPNDRRFRATVDPATGGEVAVRGRREAIERVARALLPIPVAELGSEPTEIVARPFAVDASGLPVRDTEPSPTQVAATVSLELALRRTELPVELMPPPGALEAQLESDRVVVTAPPSVLAGIERLQARVDPTTAELPPGRYTLGVVLELPDGVTSADPPRVTVTVPEARRSVSPD